MLQADANSVWLLTSIDQFDILQKIFNGKASVLPFNITIMTLAGYLLNGVHPFDAFFGFLYSLRRTLIHFIILGLRESTLLLRSGLHDIGEIVLVLPFFHSLVSWRLITFSRY